MNQQKAQVMAELDRQIKHIYDVTKECADPQCEACIEMAHFQIAMEAALKIFQEETTPPPK